MSSLSNSNTTPESIMIISVVAAFFSLFRFAVDIITTASKTAEQNEKSLAAEKNKKKDDDSSSVASINNNNNNNNNNSSSNNNNNNKQSNSIIGKRGSLLLLRAKSLRGTSQNQNMGLIANITEQGGVVESDNDTSSSRRSIEVIFSYLSVFIQASFFVYFLTMTILVAKNFYPNVLFNGIPLGAMSIGTFFNLFTSIRDFQRQRFSSIQRLFYILFTLISTLGIIVYVSTTTNNNSSSNNQPTSIIDYASMSVMIVYSLLAFIESKIFSPTYKSSNDDDDDNAFKKKKHLGRSILIILKPYFWPKATPTTSAFLNRFRAIMTWVCVSSAKACNVIAPIFLGRASTALTQMDYHSTATYAIIYCVIQFSATFFKECQSLFYLRVAQAAFVQLSELSFHHLHSLSLDWHLKKKLGEVIRSMDRGILSCDTLMKYLFLWLVPAIAECILVCIIFAVYFDYLPLAFSIFTFVFIYMVWTIVVTL